MAVHTSPRGDARRERVEAEPFTFKVPVTLAGLALHAEFKVSVLFTQPAHGCKNRSSTSSLCCFYFVFFVVDVVVAG